MKTILVVDSHRNLGLLYQQELSDEGYQVEVIHDGHQALERIALHPPDLLVMELRLRGMNGTDVVRHIAARYPALPIVLNTAPGYVQEDVVTWRAHACVAKSSDLTELKRAIRQVLATRPSEPW